MVIAAALLAVVLPAPAGGAVTRVDVRDDAGERPQGLSHRAREGACARRHDACRVDALDEIASGESIS
jgi:hypothetical protein